MDPGKVRAGAVRGSGLRGKHEPRLKQRTVGGIGPQGARQEKEEGLTWLGAGSKGGATQSEGEGPSGEIARRPSVSE